MKNSTLLLSTLISMSLASTLVMAEVKKPQKPFMKKTTHNSRVIKRKPMKVRPAIVVTKITGRFEINGCKTSKGNLRLMVNGKYASNFKLSKHPNVGSWFNYELSKLKPGRYTLKPKILGSACQQGKWKPGSHKIVIKPGLNILKKKKFRFQAKIKTLVLNGAVLTPIVNGLFKNMKIRLHNYGPKKGSGWHKSNASYIKPGSALGGETYRFNIPELKKGPYRYYVQNVNLQKLSVDMKNGTLRLSMKFEGKGTEIKGRCNGSGLEDAACIVGSDDAAPDIQMNNTRLTVSLTPKAENGKMTYASYVGVSFKANIQAQGVCKIIDICQAITKYKSKIRSAVVKNVRSKIGSNKLRKQVTNALWKVLQAKGVGKVITAHGKGNKITILYYPK